MSLASASLRFSVGTKLNAVYRSHVTLTKVNLRRRPMSHVRRTPIHHIHSAVHVMREEEHGTGRSEGRGRTRCWPVQCDERRSGDCQVVNLQGEGVVLVGRRERRGAGRSEVGGVTRRCSECDSSTAARPSMTCVIDDLVVASGQLSQFCHSFVTVCARDRDENDATPARIGDSEH